MPTKTDDHNREPKHVSAREKAAAVLRVLRGEPVDVVSQDVGVSIRRVERWQSEFVAAGSAELAKRKDLQSGNWLTKHTGSIVQWIWLLLALIVVSSLLAVLLQRSSAQ